MSSRTSGRYEIIANLEQNPNDPESVILPVDYQNDEHVFRSIENQVIQYKPSIIGIGW